MKQKALLADKRGPRQPTAHRLGLLHTSVSRGTFPGFESLSRPPQGEDSLGEWLAANSTSFTFEIFSANCERKRRHTQQAHHTKASNNGTWSFWISWGFSSSNWKCTCYHSNARPDRHEKETSQMVKFGHPYHLAFFTIVVFGQEATLLWINIYVVVDRRQVFVFEDFFDFGRRTGSLGCVVLQSGNPARSALHIGMPTRVRKALVCLNRLSSPMHTVFRFRNPTRAAARVPTYA